jgi:hypothetical protein
MSLDDPPNAQYNPYLLSNKTEIEKLERDCLEKGVPITDLKDPAVKKHKFYMDCRQYFKARDTQVVGYCTGVTTFYVFVEWKMGGGFHGRPASSEYLKNQGVRV